MLERKLLVAFLYLYTLGENEEKGGGDHVLEGVEGEREWFFVMSWYHADTRVVTIRDHRPRDEKTCTRARETGEENKEGPP